MPKLRKGRDPAWVPIFLTNLRNTANVRFACEKAEIGRRTAYDRREKFPEFKAAWDEAMEEACDALEAVAWSRAQAGSDLLTIFLLKAHRPEKYRENVHVQGEVSHRHAHAHQHEHTVTIAGKTPEEIGELINRGQRIDFSELRKLPPDELVRVHRLTIGVPKQD